MATYDTATKVWTDTVRRPDGWEVHLASLPYEDPNWATTDRGWLFGEHGRTLGHYLDYGLGHHRSSHQWCRGECTCDLGQPGMVHAVRFTRDDVHLDRTYGSEARYFPTCEEARAWIERR